MMRGAGSASTPLSSPAARRWSLVVGLALVVAFGAYCVIQRRHLAILLEVRWPFLAAAGGLVLLHRICLALRFRALCRPYGTRLPVGEALWLVLLASALNLVTPLRGGFALRAIYLKQRHGMDYANLPSLVLVSTLLSFGVGGAVILLINTVWWWTGDTVRLSFWLLGAGLCACTGGVLMAPPERWMSSAGRFGAAVQRMLQGWRVIRGDRAALAAICGLHLAVTVTAGGVIAVCFAAVGRELVLPAAMGVSVVNTLTGVINLTPANLGVQEWTTAFMGRLAGLDFHSGVAAALVMRAVGGVVNLAGGAAGYQRLFGRRRT